MISDDLLSITMNELFHGNWFLPSNSNKPDVTLLASPNLAAGYIAIITMIKSGLSPF